jgi:ubiquitin C
MSNPAAGGRRMEEMALAQANGDANVNPLKSDPELQMLLKKVDKIKKYKSFQRWKTRFLERLEQFLYEEGMVPAENSCNDFANLLKKFVKSTDKVQAFIEKGDLGDDKKTVKAALSLNEMCNSLTTAVQQVETLIPSKSQEEKKRGYTKFHLGAVLIRQGFHQYVTMKAIEDALKDIGGKLETVADRQQHDLFAVYSTQVQRFCDVMADLNLYEVMLKCLEFAEEPEEEESEDPDTIQITVVTSDGKTLRLELETTETIANIKEAIAADCGIKPDRQVLTMGGENLDDNDKTLEDLGMQDGSTLFVEPFKIPVTVNTMDGKQIKLMVDPTHYVSDIKRQIERHEFGLPAKNQRLFMNGDELADNSKTTADYGIKADSVLDLEPKFINIAVETPDGKVHMVEAKPSDTADMIKEKIAEETGMAAPRQVLKFQGNELSKGKTVKDMGIRDGSAITVEVFKVPVTVKTMDGKQIKVMVDPIDKLGDIKKQLEKESGLVPENQKLFMNGDELMDDNKTADDYGIKADSVLDLEPKSIKITVEMPDGKAHTVEVNASDTADTIKEKIAEKTGMAAPRQVLKFQGKELPKGKTVKDMGIRDGSAITVEVFKVPVTVKTMDGKQIKVMVDPIDKLGDIKKQLENESGLAPENQKLFMNGDELMDDNKTADDYGIKADSVLDLEPKSIKITVEMPDGKAHTVEVNASDTADTIKEKIAVETGMAAPRQALKFQGKELPKGKTVKDMGIRDGSAITVEVYKIPITVKTKDGTTVSLNVEPCDTINMIKKVIEKETGLEPKKQCLKLGEETLKDGRSTADECGIKAGSSLTMDKHADPIIFVDIKCGTLFAMDRDLVVEKEALTPHQNNHLDFSEATKDSATRDKILRMMKESPNLGVATQVVVTKPEVDDYELAEAEKVKSKWGVNLKKREKNKTGEEFVFVDLKTGATGELSRKKYIDMKFITPVTNGKGETTLEEGEKESMIYENYIQSIRGIFGVKSAT